MLTSIEQWKRKKKIIIGAACVFLMCLSLLGMYKNYMEKQNIEIEKTITRYYMAMDNKDMDELNKLIYPENEAYTQDFLMDVKTKMFVTNFESIKLNTIYPALIDGNIAIVGYQATTKSKALSETASFQEIGTTVLRRKGDSWYVAKPIDLQDISADYLNDFFDKYQEILRENITKKEAENVVKSQKEMFSLVNK